MGYRDNIKIRPLDSFHTSNNRSEFPNNKPFGNPTIDNYVKKIVQKQNKTFAYRRLETKIQQLEQKFTQYHLENANLINVLTTNHLQETRSREEFFLKMSEMFLEFKKSIERPTNIHARQGFNETFDQLNEKIVRLRAVNKALDTKLKQTYLEKIKVQNKVSNSSEHLEDTKNQIAHLRAMKINSDTTLAIAAQKSKKRTMALEHQLQEVSNKCITNLRDINHLKQTNAELIAKNNLVADYQKKYEQKTKDVKILSKYVRHLKQETAGMSNESEAYKTISNLRLENYELQAKAKRFTTLSENFVSAFNNVKENTNKKNQTIMALRSKLEAVSAENILLKRKGTFLDANLNKQMSDDKVAVGKVANVSLTYKPEKVAEKVETFNKSLRDLKDIREKILVKRNSYKKADQKAFVKQMDSFWGRLNWTMHLKN